MSLSSDAEVLLPGREATGAATAVIETKIS
jgi:hypothetical protein